MFRPLPLFSLAIGTILLLAGCNRQPPEPEPLVIDVASPAAFDQLLAGATSAGLTAFDGHGNVIPGLARSWRVANSGLSVIFRLREAHFENGQPILAADVASSVEAARRGDRGRMTARLLAGVTAVRAPLPNVVELILSTPQPELLELLATPPLALRPGGRRSTAAAGPYRIVMADESREAPASEPANEEDDPSATELEPDDRHFAADSVPARHMLIRQLDPEAAIRRFSRNHSHMVVGGGLDGLASARISARRQRLMISQPRASWLIRVNHAHAALADPGIRRALMLAIDRDQLGPRLFGTQMARPVAGMVPATVGGWQEYVPPWVTIPLVARQEDARRLLHEAGIDPVKERLRLSLLAGNGEGEERLANLLATDLAAVGIDIILLRADEAQYRKRLAEGDFDLALSRIDTPVNSAIPFLADLVCGHNRHGICLPEADQHLARSWQAASLADRMAALSAAERLWADDGAMIGLVQPVDWSLVASDVAGFDPGASTRLPLSVLSLEQRQRLPIPGLS